MEAGQPFGGQMACKLIELCIQIWQWRWKEGQFKTNLVVELIDLDKLEAGEEREIKSCSSVSGLNGRVNGGICCLEKMQIIGGEISEFSIFDLSISSFC